MSAMFQRRWYQFSLLSLLVIITLAALWLGWTMNYLRSLESQWEVLERMDARTVNRLEGTGIIYDAEPATVLGWSLPSRMNPKWRLVRSLTAVDEDKSREAAKEIAKFPHMVQLDLAAPALTDFDLETLAFVPKLKSLTIYSDFVTGQFLGSGTLHDTLESLDIRSQEFDNEGVRQIGRCTHLKKLVFRDEHFVGIRQGISDWNFLNNLTELEDLTLFGDFPAEALTALQKMPRLRKFAVQSGRLTDKGVAEIAKCQSIEELHTGLILTEPISVSIQSMKNLKSVLFMGSEIMPADLEKVRPDLKVIFRRLDRGRGARRNGPYGNQTPMPLASVQPANDAGDDYLTLCWARRLCGVRTAKHAVEAIQKVGGDYHSDEAIPARSAAMRFLLGDDRFGHVNSVWFFCPSKVTDADLRHLKHFPHLKEIEFGGRELDARGRSVDQGVIHVTDRGLEHLAGLTTLAQLALDNTEITDAGLVHLAGLTELEYLSLDGTHVTDAGLAHLSDFKKLTGLSVDRTSITDGGIQKLSDTLPHLPIIFR